MELYAIEKHKPSYQENDYESQIRKEFQRKLDKLEAEIQKALKHESN